MKALVHSETRRIQVSLATVAEGVNLATTIVEAVDMGNVDTATEVANGATVKAVYVEMWVRSGEVSPGSALLTLVKTVDSQPFTFADQTALNDYNNKKNIFYHTQGLTNDGAADAIPFLRGWFKIPKGKQRFGQGDRLILGIAAQALDAHICGHMVFKVYT